MKSNVFAAAAVWASLLAMSSGAIAQTKQDSTKLDPAKEEQLKQAPSGPMFSGQLFTNYLYEVDGVDGANCNKFDIERMYLTAKAALGDDWKLQVTTDIYRNATTGSYYNGLAVRLKFGFVEYDPYPSVSITMGMIPGPWHKVVETVWKYRGVVTTATDRYAYFSTADLGASVSYTLPGKAGEVAVYVLNGEGYTAPESNRFKDYVFRANFSPFTSSEALKGLVVGGYAYIGKIASTTMLTKNRFGGLVAYSYSIVTVGSEYDIRKDAPTNPDTVLTGNVLSVFGDLKMPFEVLKSLSVFGRCDIMEPNTKKGGDMGRYAVVGLAWKANDKITLTVDHQRYRMEQATLKRPDGTYVSRDKRWYLHAIINF